MKRSNSIYTDLVRNYKACVRKVSTVKRTRKEVRSLCLRYEKDFGMVSRFGEYVSNSENLVRNY